MKKKFFFKFFLFTVIATLVTFTACKDYDDDIDRLDGKIDNLGNSSTAGLAGLKSDLESSQASLKVELQKLIATSQASADKANAAAAAAQSTADAALKAGGDAQNAADAAQATADAAVERAEAAEAAAATAQETADKALVAGNDAQAAADKAAAAAAAAQADANTNKADIATNKAAAEAAQAAADQAKAAADGAQATADQAKADAAAAQADADANAEDIAVAQAAAQAAQEAADKAAAAAAAAQAAADANATDIAANKDAAAAAKAAADAAQVSADAAQVSADAAQTTANAAKAAAEKAQKAADAAQADADANALDIAANKAAAEAAQKAADAAQEAADNAQTAANKAQDTADEALENSKNNAIDIALNAEAAKKAAAAAAAAHNAADLAQNTADNALEVAEGAADAAQAAANAAQDAADAAKKAQDDATAALKQGADNAKELEEHAKKINTAQAAADAAQKTADAALKAAEAAQAKADKVGDDLLKLQGVVDGIGDRVETLEGKVEDHNTKIGELNTLISELSNLVAEHNTANGVARQKLQDQIDVLEGRIKTLEDDVAKIKEDITTLEGKLTSEIEGVYTSIDELRTEVMELIEELDKAVKSMVTSVSIVPNSLIPNNNNLSKFSALTEQGNVFVKDLPGAITFTKGKQTQTGDFFIIQVSPADAELTPAMITIQNGKGEVYDNLKVTKVERYSELFTRASAVNTGLWKVSVELIDYDKTAFDNATKVGLRKVVFAVAVGDDERKELSAYDLTLDYAGDYTPLGVLDFKVDDKNVADINNRYDNTSKSLALTGTGTLYNEQTWKTLPATAMTGTNTVLHSADNRSLKDVYPAIQGKPIKISLNDPNGQIRGMYISLDYKDNAIDSAPSEWAAWNSFSYDGLNRIVEGTEAEFTIDSEDAINDIIGFRVYAVNHDGTLVDPDGRAFYVSLGEEGTDWSALNTIVTATKGQFSALGVKSATVSTTLTKLAGATQFDWVTDKADDALTNMPAFHTYFVDASNTVLFGTDGSGSINADFSKVTKVYTEATLNDWLAYKDNKEYKGALTIKNATNHVLSTVNVTFKKVLPTAGPTDFSVKTNQIVGGVYTAYLLPNTWAASSATAGTMPLSDVFNFGASAGDIVTTFANSAPAPNSSVSITGAGLLSVGKSFVDNTTKHATKVAYSYGNISTQVVGAYTVTIEEFQTVFSNIYNHTYSWSWDSAATTDVTYGDVGKKVDLADVDGVSTRDNIYNASLAAPYLSSLNVVSAKLVSNANQLDEYFTVTPDPLAGATTFTLVPASGATNPTADVASTLILTAKDMYDNDITIKLPFTVKKR